MAAPLRNSFDRSAVAGLLKPALAFHAKQGVVVRFPGDIGDNPCMRADTVRVGFASAGVRNLRKLWAAVPEYRSGLGEGVSSRHRPRQQVSSASAIAYLAFRIT